MFKTEVTYTNFLDQEVTETLRFNLREDELLDLVREDPTFDSSFLAYISQQQDFQKMMKVIRRLISLSYGEVSEDGRSFRKSEQRAMDFLQSSAYTTFVDKILSDNSGKLFMDFLVGTFPAKFSEQLIEKVNDGGRPQLTTVK